MIVLRSNIELLRKLGMFYNENQREDTLQDFAYNLMCTFGLTCTIIGLLFYLNEHITDVNAATEAAYVICALGLFYITYWQFVSKKPQSRRVMDELQGIVRERNAVPNMNIYIDLEEKSSAFNKKFVEVILGMCIGCYIVPFGLAGYQWVMGTYTHDVWFVVYKIITPYDQRTLYGYILTEFIEFLGGIGGIVIMVAINSFYFGICWYMEGLMDDLTGMLGDVDKSLGMRDAKELTARLKKTISFHNTVIKFLDNFNEFFEGIIFVTLCLSVLWICSVLVQLQYSALLFDSFLIQCLVTLSMAVSNLFIYCHFGQIVATKFARVADEMYAVQWYKYPLAQQKFMILMLIRAHRPFYFTGYFISNCSAETFKAIVNKAISFFMVLRAAA